MGWQPTEGGQAGGQVVGGWAGRWVGWELLEGSLVIRRANKGGVWRSAWLHASLTCAQSEQGGEPPRHPPNTEPSPTQALQIYNEASYACSRRPAGVVLRPRQGCVLHHRQAPGASARRHAPISVPAALRHPPAVAAAAAAAAAAVAAPCNVGRTDRTAACSGGQLAGCESSGGSWVISGLHAGARAMGWHCNALCSA